MHLICVYSEENQQIKRYLERFVVDKIMFQLFDLLDPSYAQRSSVWR